MRFGPTRPSLADVMAGYYIRRPYTILARQTEGHWLYLRGYMTRIETILRKHMKQGYINQIGTTWEMQ
jgi:hypothetical protein